MFGEFLDLELESVIRNVSSPPGEIVIEAIERSAVTEAPRFS